MERHGPAWMPPRPSQSALNAAAPAFMVVPPLPPPRRERSRLWELNGSIHCSIIGTCLTTAELRRAMGRALKADVGGCSDHDLHAQAVGLCGHHGPAAKLLQKTLDARHEAVVKRFMRLHDEAAVLAAWAEARQAGDIPGAYWAVLSHPDTSHAGLRRVFGDVHMLSHLVGAANRADIRRLTALEAENAALRDKVERQQRSLHEQIATRDATIRRLGQLAAAGIKAAPVPDEADGLAGLRHLVGDLQTRLDRETARRDRVAQRLSDTTEAMRRQQRRAEAAEVEAGAARDEVAILEHLHAAAPSSARPLPPACVLYVGGRPGSVDQIRALLDEAGGRLLAHDGGRHDNPSLLPGLIGQADRVVFPVDCVSHDAALTVKRLCRQLGKAWAPLRSSGLASFLAAIQNTQQEVA